MRREHRATAILVAAGMLLSGCYGPFHLTRKVHAWNGTVGDKWVNEIVFLVCAWLPVYGIATLADAVIFNTIEFWGGQNPVASLDGPRTKRIVRGDSEAVMTVTGSAGQEALLIEQFQGGQAAGSLTVRRTDNTTIATNDKGETVFMAQTKPDGSIVVSDATGKTVASYSAEHVKQARAAVTK